MSINRIRLEFKVGRHQAEDIGWHRINRIRLEFKVCWFSSVTSCPLVLIESDWNLKRDMEMSTIVGAGSFNRIRLEFKDYLII